MPRILLPTVLVAATAVALTGCLGPVTPAPSPTGSAGVASPTPSPEATYEALSIENCGYDVDFEQAPERVVTIKSSTTELLLALGLGDRIVGVAFQDGPLPDEWDGELDGVPVLSDRVPSAEVVLEAEPDLVFAGWESNFSADGAGERDELESLGVHTYVSPPACQSADMPDPLTWDDVFGAIEQTADIFGVDASELIAEQESRLENIAYRAGEGKTAFWYSSGSDTPFAGGGIGAPQLLMESVGLTNIAEDLDAAWAPFNWEAVVDADPDFIVLVDSSWNSAEKKIQVLESNPATAKLTAVEEGNYLILPFATTEAGVRSVEGAFELASQLDDSHGP